MKYWSPPAAQSRLREARNSAKCNHAFAEEPNGTQESRVSSHSLSAAPSRAPGRLTTGAPVILWPLLALALGSFGIGTTEFVSMGLLPDIARGIGTSIPQTGHVISAYAIGVVVGAPTFAALGVRLRRRTLLIALMAMYGGDPAPIRLDHPTGRNRRRYPAGITADK